VSAAPDAPDRATLPLVRSAPGWVCVACRARNDLAADVCGHCGTSFAQLLGGAVPKRRSRGPMAAAAAREAVLLFALFALWRVVGSFSVGGRQAAFERGNELWRLERGLHLPSEVGVQAQLLGHPVAVQALDVFYLAAHTGSLLVLLPWLFFRHREEYRRWRNVIVVFTAAALLVQFISVAPPRLLPQLGFVDTAARYHQSAYVHLGPGLVDQLSAMPSIHVGWSVIVALAVTAVLRTRWRLLIWAHPVLTCYAVVATANHFWLDGVGAVALLALMWWLAPAAGRLAQRVRSHFAASPA
jgi:PAP2 superfamily